MKNLRQALIEALEARREATSDTETAEQFWLTSIHLSNTGELWGVTIPEQVPDCATCGLAISHRHSGVVDVQADITTTCTGDNDAMWLH